MRTGTKAVLGLALAMGWVAAAPTVAPAATTSVTTTDDISALDGLASLREVIGVANGNGEADTIVLEPLTYTLTDCAAGPLVHTEANDLTIQGNGATIVQTCPDQRIFDEQSNAEVLIQISDLTLVNTANSGVNIDGAAIRRGSDATMVLTNIAIDSVDAGFGGSIVHVDFGPSIGYIDLELDNVTITNNIGTAVANTSHSGVRLTDSTISANSGSGLAFSDGTPTVVLDSTIANNGGTGIVTSGQGNGVQPDVIIERSTIHNNGAGGVRCVTSCRSLGLDQSEVTDNGHAAPAGRGGGITMPFFVNPGFTGQSVSITGSVISGNHADHPGGGLWIASTEAQGAVAAPLVSIHASTIADNSATNGNHGGGIAVDIGNLTITDSTIANNSAGTNGGGIAMTRRSFDSLTSDTAFTLTDSTVEANTAGGRGGGAWVHSSTQTIERTTFVGNAAGNTGGGLEVGGITTDTEFIAGTAEITATTINDNTALYGGGFTIGSPDGSTASLTNSTVVDNTAWNAGGGALVGPTEQLDLLHVTMTGNSSPEGANLVSSGSTTIRASILAHPLGGGGNCAAFPFGPYPLRVTSAGWNWLDDATCGTAKTSDSVVPGADPQLGPLTDNGGPTLTRAPAHLSPIRSTISARACIVATDQLGSGRPLGAGCEPGSVEIEGAPTFSAPTREIPGLRNPVIRFDR